MRLPDGEGLELVRHIAGLAGDLPVAVITAHGSAENAVAALKAGAFDYVSKPVGLEQLRALVKSALSLPGRGEAAPAGPQLLGDSAPMREVRDMIAKLARTQAPVHISGESGSGKELAARQIHVLGARRDGAFVPVNCGAIPESLMESEFFGYRKGAFTGAQEDRDGFFQAANGGTLFLDEVAELPLLMQVKLLRAIQEKRVRKVGATQEDPVDVRVICATHQDLAARGRGGQLPAGPLLPPERDRAEDAAAARVPRGYRADRGRDPRAPGRRRPGRRWRASRPRRCRNCRPTTSRATSASLRISSSAPSRSRAPRRSPPTRCGCGRSPATAMPAGARAGSPLPEYLDRIEREAILDALAKTGFNRTAAAKLLGLTFRTLRYRMQRLGIREPEQDGR